MATQMTVRELREQLAFYDDDALVGFTYDYGDYCHTDAVAFVRTLSQEDVADWSGYAGYRLRSKYDEDDDIVAPGVVVLS